MVVFSFRSLNTPLAIAIKSFAEYFSWPAGVCEWSQALPFGRVLIRVVESDYSGFRAMRELEAMRKGQERPVLLFAPDSGQRSISEISKGMANIFYIPASVVADDLISRIIKLLKELSDNRQFFLESESAEESFSKRRYIDALSAAKRMLSMNYDPFVAHMIIGRTMFMSDKLSLALEHGRKALDSRPASISAASLVAATYQKLGQSSIAEKYLVKFLPHAETSIIYMAQLGDVYFENGKIPDAKTMYARANQLDPQSEAPLKGLLAVSILEGQVRASRQMMTGRLAHIDMARFCNLRGIALTANKRFSLAERLYLNSADLLGEERDVYKIFFNLGLCMKKSGQYSKAFSYFQKCARTAPKAFSRAAEQLRHLSARMR